MGINTPSRFAWGTFSVALVAAIPASLLGVFPLNSGFGQRGGRGSYKDKPPTSPIIGTPWSSIAHLSGSCALLFGGHRTLSEKSDVRIRCSTALACRVILRINYLSIAETTTFHASDFNSRLTASAIPAHELGEYYGAMYTN